MQLRTQSRATTPKISMAQDKLKSATGLDKKILSCADRRQKACLKAYGSMTFSFHMASRLKPLSQRPDHCGRLQTTTYVGFVRFISKPQLFSTEVMPVYPRSSCLAVRFFMST